MFVYVRYMKLLSASTPGKNDYTEFMTKFVCDIENHYCILHIAFLHQMCKYE